MLQVVRHTSGSGLPSGLPATKGALNTSRMSLSVKRFPISHLSKKEIKILKDLAVLESVGRPLTSF